MSASFSDEEKYAIDASGNAEASLTFPTQASALRKGGYAMLNSKPCKLLEISTSKPGKHGHAKCNIRGKDIFTDGGVETSCPASHNMDVPVVKKTEYDLMYISGDGFLQLLASDGGVKSDVKVPEGEVGGRIKAIVAEDKTAVVVILAAMGKEFAIDVKAITED